MLNSDNWVTYEWRDSKPEKGVGDGGTVTTQHQGIISLLSYVVMSRV